MRKTRKNDIKYKRRRNKQKTRKHTLYGGEDTPPANPGAPVETSTIQKQIEELFNQLTVQKENIKNAEEEIENIKISTDKTTKKIKDMKVQNKKIRDAYYEIEKILNDIKKLSDKEAGQRGKKILDMYAMKFYHEPGKKTPTVYFDRYQPSADQKTSFGIDDEEFWINPTLQLNAIDEILDMKKASTKYKPEIFYYKVQE